MNNGLLTAIETEQALVNLVTDLKARIASEVQGAPHMAGVRVISDSPRCAVVSSRALLRSLRINMSPRYYLQSAQADAVASAVASCRTVTELLERLRGMVEQGKVSHGEDAGTQLNEQTIQVLREFIL